MISTTTYKVQRKHKDISIGVSRQLLGMPLGSLKPLEINLLYGLLHVASRDPYRITKTNYREIRKITQNPSRHKTRLLKQIESMNDKVNRNGKLFQTLIVDYDKDEIVIQPSRLLSKHLNGDKVVNLNVLFNLESVYSKKIYLIMCAYDNGSFYIKTETFRNFLNIPKSYKMSKIDNHVTKPSLKELNQYMPVKLKKVKIEGAGNKIQGFRFKYPAKSKSNKDEKIKSNNVSEVSVSPNSKNDFNFTFNFNINN